MKQRTNQHINRRMFSTAEAMVYHCQIKTGKSQNDIAAVAGTSQPQLGRIIRGQQNVGVETLRRLADACGFDFEIRFVERR